MRTHRKGCIRIFMSMCTHLQAYMPMFTQKHESKNIFTCSKKLSHVHVSIQLLSQTHGKTQQIKSIPKHDQEKSKNKKQQSMSISKHA